MPLDKDVNIIEVDALRVRRSMISHLCGPANTACCMVVPPMD